jgi:hypothetical protein
MIKKWPPAQDVLNHLPGCEVSLKELTQALGLYAQIKPGRHLGPYFDGLCHGSKVSNLHLVVGPHADATYKELGSIPKSLDEILAACRKAMNDPAIDKTLPVWFERRYDRRRPVRHTLIADEWDLRVTVNSWVPDPE